MPLGFLFRLGGHHVVLHKLMSESISLNVWSTLRRMFCFFDFLIPMSKITFVHNQPFCFEANTFGFKVTQHASKSRLHFSKSPIMFRSKDSLFEVITYAWKSRLCILAYRLQSLVLALADTPHSSRNHPSPVPVSVFEPLPFIRFNLSVGLGLGPGILRPCAGLLGHWP